MKHVFLLFFLMMAGFAAMSQTRTLTGFVRDSATNSPVPYATVKVAGRNIVATTGTNGGFSIGLPTASTTLDVSYVGYATQSIAVDENDNNIIVLLGQSKTGNLNEVVVTALGISKDSRKLGYAVSTVNGDQFNKARETNVALSLSGQVAGLDVHGTNGGPGGTARILLRGMSSMNSGGSPLFVINGVPIDNSNRGSAGEWGGADAGDGISNINPDDIETMTVLKGQAASALYGARASNGVIQITTKSGKKGTATVTYNTNYQVDKAIDNTDFQYQYGQGQNGNKPANATEARNTARLSWGSKMDGSTFTQFDGKQYSYSPYKNNIENFYRTGPTFTNTVSV
ncbi:MAG: TonB-dependent receptor plug domain-containing protein, partial [Bacteroidota bacterium]|nr:TonB-dependent receptor plug domain-containing protein [Bacteroidota bacterium]